MKICVLLRPAWGAKRGDTFNEKYWTGSFTATGKPQQTSLVYQAAKFDSPDHAYRIAGRRKVLQRWIVGWRDEESIQ